MAIRTMTTKEAYEAAVAAGATNIEKISNYPGHEEGLVNHTCYDCLHKNDPDFKFKFGPGCVNCWAYGALYMETSYEGKVLALGEYNGYDDSDFYAVVWTGAGTKRVTYATTRGWTYPNNAWVDATPEVMAAYTAYCEEVRKVEAAKRAAAEAAKPAKGKTLKVVKGRKVPVGTTGVCIWVGAGTYGTRVGIKDAAGDVHWTAESNVEVVA